MAYPKRAAAPQFIAETELLDLALSIAADGLKLGLMFQDALFAHVEGELDQPDGAKPRNDWNDVTALLSESDLSAFRLRLLGAFKSIRGRVAGVLPFYGPLLAKLVLEDGPEKSYERVKQIIEILANLRSDGSPLWRRSGSRSQSQSGMPVRPGRGESKRFYKRIFPRTFGVH